MDIATDAVGGMREAIDLSSRMTAQDGEHVKGFGNARGDLLRNVLLERQSRLESNARSYPRRLPIALGSGQGVFVTDTQGRTYIDCLAGAGALTLGHSHPVAVEAIQRTLAQGLPFQTLDLTTPVKDQFIQDLFNSLPREFSERAKIQFCGSFGADLADLQGDPERLAGRGQSRSQVRMPSLHQRCLDRYAAVEPAQTYGRIF